MNVSHLNPVPTQDCLSTCDNTGDVTGDATGDVTGGGDSAFPGATSIVVHGVTIAVKQGDICDEQTDAIVNGTNNSLDLSKG